MLLSAEHLYKSTVDKVLLEDASFYLDTRQKTGIVGLNGSGKTTLLKILAGIEQPDAGSVTRGRNVRVAYLEQDIPHAANCSALDYLLTEQNGEAAAYEARRMLSRLGISDANAPLDTLSGGQKKRAALARTLLREADILILDEPTNHLDSEMVLWLEEYLKSYAGGLIMVTHDRYFLERVTGHITELSAGKLFSTEGNYSRYLELKAERMSMAQASERKRQAILRHEYEWVMRGVRARGTKSKERLQRYDELLSQSAPEENRSVKMISAASRMGKKLIELHQIGKSFDGRPVIRNFSHNLLRSERIGIVGTNGAGKTTLLNLIAGQIVPDEGEMTVGETVRIGYFKQDCRALDPTMRVYDFLTGIADRVETDEGVLTAAQLLENFLFTPAMQSAPIGKLSGGERRRLVLLSILITAPNVLLLDEPTNDLDIETLTIFEEYLMHFPGSVLAVSHDRYFLDKIAQDIWDVSGGQVTCYAGNFSDYLEKRPATLPQEKKDDQPNRTASAARRPQERKRRLSFREQRDLDSIDGEIEALEQKKAELEAACEASGSDYVRLIALTEELDTVKAQLDSKTERWLELQELLEEIASQQ